MNKSSFYLQPDFKKTLELAEIADVNEEELLQLIIDRKNDYGKDYYRNNCIKKSILNGNISYFSKAKIVATERSIDGIKIIVDGIEVTNDNYDEIIKKFCPSSYHDPYSIEEVVSFEEKNDIILDDQLKNILLKYLTVYF